MNWKLFFLLLIIFNLFFSCSSGNKIAIHASSEEIIQNLENPISLKQKYKNKDVYITGIIKYIGEPKDTFSKTNASYIEMEGKNNISLIIYFDYLITKDVKIGQKVNVKCTFRKLYRANHFCDEDLIEFYDGELITVFN